LILLIPVLAFGQTVHVEKDQIIYKGTVKADNLNQEELFGRAKKAIINNVNKNENVISDDNKNRIATRGSIKLKSSYHLIKTVEFNFELTIKNGEYTYIIDSVFLKQVERGGKTIVTSSQEL